MFDPIGNVCRDWEELQSPCDLETFSWKSIDHGVTVFSADDPLPDLIHSPTIVEFVDEIEFLDELGEEIEMIEASETPSVSVQEPQKETKKAAGKSTKFECDECGQFLSSQTSLKTHKQSHGGKRSYKCEICSKSFARSDVLKNHQMIHGSSSGKKFRCDEDKCGKSFYRAADLRSHQKIHNDIRPYSCADCGKPFKRLGDLRSHGLTHERKIRFLCSLGCNKTFLSLGGLKYHMKVHSGDKPYACTKCDQRFRQSGNLTKHIRKSHA